MVGTSPPVALPGQFTIPFGTLSITKATITPQTPSFSYRRATGYSNNNSFTFDISGGHAQSGTWLITTTATTTVTFLGQQPASIVCTCSAVYTGGGEVLTFNAGLTASSFTGTWNGSNLSCLCSIVESVNPIGDLSAVVAKELEFSYYFAASSASFGGCFRCFGFFLTTNASLWQTNLQSFDPYSDNTVSLLDVMGQGTTTNYLYLQQKPGESIQTEDTGCRTGSVYLCASFGGGVLGDYAYFDLNFTGASLGSQVGSGVSCPTAFPGAGGSGCSYIQANDCALGGCGITTAITAGTPLTPKLPISAAIYYAGFWVAAGDTSSTVSFCFDTGAKCSAPQTPIVSGCVTASMELDACVPNPVSGVNALGSVTDSGGFVGAALRLLSGAGQTVLGLGNNAVNFLTNTLAGPWNAVTNFLANSVSRLAGFLFGAVIGLLNTIGGIIGLPNLGSNVLLLLQSIVGFFGVFFTDLIANLVQQVGSWVTIIKGLVNLLGTYYTDFNNWMTGIFNFLSFLWQVGGLLLGIPFAFMFTGWMFYGILRALRSMQSWWDWYHTTGYGVLLGLSISWYLFVLFVNHIIIPIVNTITAMATSEQAVKPDMSGAALAAA